ncbi:hypothetical protein BDV12DRAFT_71635 [Aspergillus spectabilis]
MGAITSVATIVRLVYIPALTMDEVVQLNNRIIFWSIIETAICIISTAAATWKPLVVWLLQPSHSSYAEPRSFLQVRKPGSIPLQDASWD